MKSILSATAAMIAWAGLCLAAEPLSVKPDEALAWLAKTPTAQVLDVRSQKEFATGHLANAIVIPWGDKDFIARAAKELDLKKPLFVYCRSGRRSTEAAAALAELGFTGLRHLDGGVLAWKAAGKPLVNP